MFQGICRKWKQPVAYFFANNACSSSNLRRILCEIIDAGVEIAGLNIVGTVCDMGTTNVKALKEMNSCSKRPYIERKGKRIYTMFDPPHLLKCTVSLFRKHNVLLPVNLPNENKIMEAKFEDIRTAYEIDVNTPLVFRARHKIRENHLAPIMKFAMKVV
ncbi:hypothetical protein ABEB36_012599 [Hypothenemus hampei]|uniref:Transposable element P transposase-like RNase H domain-containing protein n=1 Tax=Hypothenemus hampei TaxID=57062 RepID=A0ABD1EBT7_HYPHA